MQIEQQSLTINICQELALGLRPKDQRWISLSRSPGQIEKTYKCTCLPCNGIYATPPKKKKEKRKGRKKKRETEGEREREGGGRGAIVPLTGR